MFSDYLTPLENAATWYDAQQQTASLRIGDDTHHVYMAQMDFFGDLHEDPGPWDPGFDQDAIGDHDDFDVDVPLSTVTVFAAQQCSCPRPLAQITVSIWQSTQNFKDGSLGGKVQYFLA
jgi:hypothetical protein